MLRHLPPSLFRSRSCSAGHTFTISRYTGNQQFSARVRIRVPRQRKPRYRTMRVPKVRKRVYHAIRFPGISRSIVSGTATYHSPTFRRPRASLYRGSGMPRLNPRGNMTTMYHIRPLRGR